MTGNPLDSDGVVVKSFEGVTGFQDGDCYFLAGSGFEVATLMTAAWLSVKIKMSHLVRRQNLRAEQTMYDVRCSEVGGGKVALCKEVL